MKKQQSLLGKSNDSSYLAKRFATPVKVTSGIGLLAAGAIAVVGNGIDFSLPTYGYWKKGSCLKKKSYPSSIRESKITLYLFESSTIVQKPFKKETAETPLVIRALLSTLVFCIDHRSKAQSITCTGSWSIWSSREYKSSPRVLLLPIFLHTWSKAKIRHHVET